MKRFFYGLLAAVLLIICVPVSVFADGSQERTEIEAEADDADGTFTVEYYMNPIVGGATSQDANGYRHYSWGVNAMKADVLADYVSKRAGDQSVTVAVLDSGVDFTHPYLSGRLLNNGFDYVESDEDPSDDYGHGTSVAGIIVDCTQGLNVNILPIKVLDYSGEGNNESIAEGIDYAIEQGADVINLSLSITENILAEPVDEAIDDAVEAGIIVVAAAGNHHRNTSTVCPAHRDDIIVVAAVDEDLNNMYFYNDNGSLVSSNYGDSVDVTAPGVNL